jgi:hypothetical protein
MLRAVRRSILATSLACACGPSVGPGGGDSMTSDDTTESSSTTGSASNSSPLPGSSGPDDTSGPDGTTDGTTGGSVDGSSGGSTGPGGEPVGCYETNDPGDAECCPELPQPCPVVSHVCRDDGACSEAPYAGPVVDPMAAQCMLDALADGGAAVFRQRATYGLGEATQQWLVAPSGVVILVRSVVQDFGFSVETVACQLVDAGSLSACAEETDPATLADCLATAVEGCEEAGAPVCPE